MPALKYILLGGLLIGLFFILWPMALRAGRALGLGMKHSVEDVSETKFVPLPCAECGEPNTPSHVCLHLEDNCDRSPIDPADDEDEEFLMQNEAGDWVPCPPEEQEELKKGIDGK